MRGIVLEWLGEGRPSNHHQGNVYARTPGEVGESNEWTLLWYDSSLPPLAFFVARKISLLTLFPPQGLPPPQQEKFRLVAHPHTTLSGLPIYLVLHRGLR